MESKRCEKCGEMKPASDFHKDKSNKTGLQRKCKACNKIMAADWWARNGKAAYRKHAEYQKEWKNRHKDRRARIATYGHIRRKYGLSQEQYVEMVAEQLSRCAMCNEVCDNLAVDHCHATGKIRQLLCTHCNKALSGLRDRTDLALAAIKYLEKHNEPKD